MEMLNFSYRNESNKMVVLRCIGEENFFMEKVLLPAELIILSAPEDAKVEIWGTNLYGPKLEERIRIRNQNHEEPYVA